MTDLVRDHIILQRLAGPLLHFLWQGALLAAVTAVLLRVLARRSAEIRYAIAIGALVAMAAAPALTFLFADAVATISRTVILTFADALAAPASGTEGPQLLIDWDRWLAPVVMLWLAGVGFCTTRLTVAWYFTLRLRRTRVKDFPDTVAALVRSAEALFSALARQLALVRPVKLIISDQLGSPLAAGWLRPIVLLPLAAITGLSEPQLRAVLAHELAHIRRCDFLVNVVQRCVESLLFYHPAVWWLSARIRAEREHCCDDLAVRVCGDAFVYAQALVDLEQLRTTSPALALAGTGKGLTRRVLRLLGRESQGNDWHETLLVWTFLLAIAIGVVWPANTAQAQPAPQASPVELGGQKSESPQPASITNILPQAREFLLALAGPQNRAQTSAAATPAQSNEDASIEGVVVRLGTNGPVARANVTLYLEDVSSVLPTLAGQPPAYVSGYLAGMFSADANVSQNRNLISAMRQATTTDENGKFAFAGVKPGRYRLSSTRNGYVRGEYGQRQAGSAGTPIVLGGKQALKNVRITLTPTGAITGRIYDAANEPLRNATVRALKYVYQDGRRVLRQIQEAKSNDLGDYRLAELQPGRYILSASFVQPTTIGNPLENPLERPDNPSGRAFAPVFYPGVTDLPSAALIDILPGVEFPGANLTMVQMSTVHVSGRVTTGDNSQAVGQATVTLVPRNSDPLARTASQTTRTSAVGNFEFGGVLPGSYDLLATVGGSTGFTYSFGYSLAGANPLLSRPANQISRGSVAIEVGSYDVENTSLVLQTGFNVSGKVDSPNLRSGDHNRINVVLEPELPQTPSSGTTPAADGTFTIRNVTPGEYWLTIAGLPRGAYVKSARLDGADVLGSTLRIDTPPRGPIEIVIGENAATLDAVVFNEKQEPAAAVTVVLIPDSLRQRFDLYRSGSTDAEGRVHIDGIVPGDYKVFAWENAENGAWTDPDFVRAYETRGKALPLREGDKATTELKVIP